MKTSKFDQLIKLMETLRSEKGCPWDREQTLNSLKPYMVEECYEVWEAIDDGNPEKIKEELGDLLFQIVFYGQIAKEKLGFDIYDIAETVKNKMVRRHPHVFGDTKVKDSNQVLSNWEEIKKKERGINASVLEGVPKKLPALIKAHRIQAKAARVGFDWNEAEQTMDKVDEELNELKSAYREGNLDHIEEEMGDLLFTLVNFARFMKLNPEDTLQKTIRKFTRRFQYIEKKIAEEGGDLKKTTLERMEELWKEAKKLGNRG